MFEFEPKPTSSCASSAMGVGWFRHQVERWSSVRWYFLSSYLRDVKREASFFLAATSIGQKFAPRTLRFEPLNSGIPLGFGRALFSFSFGFGKPGRKISVLW